MRHRAAPGSNGLRRSLLCNPTARAFTDDAGATTLFVSGFAFWQGAGFGEAGQFIALRRLG